LSSSQTTVPPLDVRQLKINFQLRGGGELRPLIIWPKALSLTPLGDSSPGPCYRLALRARHVCHLLFFILASGYATGRSKLSCLRRTHYRLYRRRSHEPIELAVHRRIPYAVWRVQQMAGFVDVLNVQ